MDQLFATGLAYRHQLVTTLEKLDDDQLDIIPENFHNSIRWNIAHLIVTPCLLTYHMVGQTSPLLSSEFISSAKKGTDQEDFSMNEDFGKKHLLETLIESIKQLQRDIPELEKHDFKNYETSTGFVLTNLESALSYSNIHDGVHIGAIAAMIKIIKA
jgi:hypothetical protein